MKFSLKTIAAAVVMAAAAAGAQADITTGAAGNGELFFNIWDANGSYTRGLNIQINSFESGLAATGDINLSWAADSLLTSWLSTADVATLKWNIVANDTQGNNRLLTTYTAPEMADTKTNDVMRTAGLNVSSFLSSVNAAMPNTAGASVTAVTGAAAYAGGATFGDYVAGKLNFSNAGSLANSSFASGLGFMRIDALVGGGAKSVYNEYLDGTTAVNVWLDASQTLHIGAVAAVPEPESYAMLLAGLGMIGLMARRRQNRA